jgi:hypothetical protein
MAAAAASVAGVQQWQAEMLQGSTRSSGLQKSIVIVPRLHLVQVLFLNAMQLCYILHRLAPTWCLLLALAERTVD